MDKKYYKNRKIEMERLRFEERASTAQIGKKFGVSGERVRQIIGNTSHLIGIYSRYSNTLHNQEWMAQRSDKTHKEIADEIGCHARYVDGFRLDREYPYKPNSVLGKTKNKILYVKDVLSNLSELNVIVMPRQSPYNLLANNDTCISVRVCMSGWNPPSQKKKSPAYRFRLNNKIYTDFYVLIIDDRENDVYAEFIVPTEDIRYSAEFAVFCYPALYSNKSKYLKYRDRWDLIKNE